MTPVERDREYPRWLLKELPAESQPGYRLEQMGAPSLSDAELLALYLWTPDALSLAIELLGRFGSLHGVAEATVQELQQVKGIGPQSARNLKALLEVARRLNRVPERIARVCSPADAANLVMWDMARLEQEELWVILLDTRNQVISVERLYKGSLNSTVVRVSEVFRQAIRCNAAGIIVVHNHPSGDPSPSPEDVAVTRKLVQSGDALDISLIDHVIIGKGRFVSLKERGLGFERVH